MSSKNRKPRMGCHKTKKVGNLAPYILIPFIVTLLSQISFASVYLTNNRSEELILQGQLFSTNIPRLYQPFKLQLNLTSNVEVSLNLLIIFNLPEEVKTAGITDFESLLPAKSSSQFYVDAEIAAVGSYSLQASVYQKDQNRPGQMTIIRHFFAYVKVSESDSEMSQFPFPLSYQPRFTSRVNLQQRAELNIINVRGQIVYFDDNLRRELPVKVAKVVLMEENIFSGDQQIKTTFTNEDGRYEFLNVENFDPEDATRRDIYLNVFFENDIVRIRDQKNLLYKVISQTLMNVPNGEVNFDQTMGSSNDRRGLGAIMNTFKDAYDFMLKTANWKRQKMDVKWPADQNTSNYLYISDDFSGRVLDEVISIALGDEWNRQAIVHEYGHSIMTAGYGNAKRLPQSDPIRVHFIYTVSNPQFALLEGWAAFYEAGVDDDAFNVTSFKNLKTPNIETNAWWSGRPDGTGTNTRGELVEGTVASILWDIFDTPQSVDHTPNEDDEDVFSMFAQIWQVMTETFPKDIIQLAESWKKLGLGKLPELEDIYSKNRVKINLTKPWDVNMDGVVDIFDLVIVASSINLNPQSKDMLFNPDVNRDGVIDVLDLVLVANNFGPTV